MLIVNLLHVVLSKNFIMPRAEPQAYDSLFNCVFACLLVCVCI